MTATNRKRHNPETKELATDQTVREVLNHYSTPPYVTRALLARLGVDLRGKTVLECAAGEGAMVDVLADAGAIVDAVEIDSGRSNKIRSAGRARETVHGDFLAPATTSTLRAYREGTLYDAVISNPPYSEKIPNGYTKRGKPKFRHRDLALEFVQKALTLAPLVAMLLRLNWAGSKARHEFHVKNPADLVVLGKRPSYVGKGTDSTEYAWWIWRRGSTIGTWVTHLSLDAPKAGRKVRYPKAVPAATEGVAGV